MPDNQLKIVRNDWWTNKRLEVKQAIQKELEWTSPMQVTDIEKIVINTGVKVAKELTLLEKVKQAIEKISQGQKPTPTKAHKSIIGFKIRKGMIIGYKVTLRRRRAWNFLFSLININLPLINNFRGISKKKFDKFGNLNLGLNSLNTFPVVPFDLRNCGIQITIVFRSNKIIENTLFLELFKFPFQKH